VIKAKKQYLTLAFILFALPLFAQQLSGIVLDRNALMPIAGVTLSSPAQTAITSAKGLFTLGNLNKGDTIMISCVGYKPHYLVFSQPVADTIPIYIEQDIKALKNVIITGKRDAAADSIRLRKEFARVFDHKGPSFKDIFVTRSPYSYTPNDYITAPNNATTLIRVDLLSVIGMLGNSNAPVSRLQKTLLKEEDYDFLDRKFSKQKVMELTPLKGDSLLSFMDKYRPSVAQAKRMSDYDVRIYIKKCYAEFVPAKPDTR
jgi:hypothetical protein